MPLSVFELLFQIPVLLPLLDKAVEELNILIQWLTYLDDPRRQVWGHCRIVN